MVFIYILAHYLNVMDTPLCKMHRDRIMHAGVHTSLAKQKYCMAPSLAFLARYY